MGLLKRFVPCSPHTGSWFASPAAVTHKSCTAFCSVEQAVKMGACATLSCPGVFQALLQLGIIAFYVLFQWLEALVFEPGARDQRSQHQRCAARRLARPQVCRGELFWFKEIFSFTTG